MAQADNVMMIVGRVGGDPEMKYIDSDRVVTKFSVAVNRPTRAKETDWFSCEFWGKQAELAGEYIKKGTLLSVVGSGRIDKWENNGEKKSRFFILGDTFRLLSSRNENLSEHAPSQNRSPSPSHAQKPKSNDFDDLDDDIPPF